MRSRGGKLPVQLRWRAGYHRLSDDAIMRHEFDNWNDAVTDVGRKLESDDVDHAWVRAPDGKLFWTNDSVDWDHPWRNPRHRYATVDIRAHLNALFVNLVVFVLFLGIVAVLGTSLIVIVYFLAGWL